MIVENDQRLSWTLLIETSSKDVHMTARVCKTLCSRMSSNSTENVRSEEIYHYELCFSFLK